MLKSCKIFVSIVHDHEGYRIRDKTPGSFRVSVLRGIRLHLPLGLEWGPQFFLWNFDSGFPTLLERSVSDGAWTTLSTETRRPDELSVQGTVSYVSHRGDVFLPVTDLVCLVPPYLLVVSLFVRVKRDAPLT